MDCKGISKLLSRSFDDELSVREGDVLEYHLRTCDRCRLEKELWSRYERKLTRFYQSQQLDESFVERVHEALRGARMDAPGGPRPEISGRVHAPAFGWLQPLGIAAAALLAVFLLALRSDPILTRLLEGTGFLLGNSGGIQELASATPRRIGHGDVVWTDAAHGVRLQLPGNVSLFLAQGGLLSMESRGDLRGAARLHAGRVQVGGGGDSGPFALNTEAGTIEGQAGRVDVTALWVPLAEKRWQRPAASGAWTEGWQGVPVARVQVTDGRASIRSGGREVAGVESGEQAILTPAVETPVFRVAAPAAIQVQRHTESLGGSAMRSRLVGGPSGLLMETIFVDVPLRTVLSSVAEVPATGIQLASAEAAQPVSLRVLRPLDAAPEETLAAVARFAGMNVHKEMQWGTASLVAMAPDGPERASASGLPRLNMEMEDGSIKHLRGTAVRLSVLTQALEESLGRPVELTSADWAIGDFDLSDIPLDSTEEVLGRELGLEFRREQRPLPVYRISVDPVERDKTAPARDRTVRPGERSRSERSASDERQRLSIPFYGKLASWFYGLGNRLVPPPPVVETRLPPAPIGSLHLGGSLTNSQSAGVGLRAAEEQWDLLREENRDRVAQRLLEQWSGERVEARRLIFTALGQDGLQSILYSFFNPGRSTLWARLELKDAGGNTLDSTYLELPALELVTLDGEKLFRSGLETGPAYVEASASRPISGFEILFRGSSLAMLPGQPTGAHRRLYAAQVLAGQDGTRVKLVNTSPAPNRARVSLALEDGRVLSEVLEVTLEGHAAQEFSLDAALSEGSASGGLLIEADQDGLVGHIWTHGRGRREAPAVAMPLQSRLAQEWQFTLAASEQQPLLRQLAVFNPSDEAATVTIELRDGSGLIRSVPVDAARLPAAGTGRLFLPEQAERLLVVIRSSQPLAASVF